MRSIVLALIALLALSACQHTAKFTPAGERCNLVRYSLETPLPDETPLRSILDGNPGDMLLLSGGSQDGAFGAGFIDGWHESGTMPDFKLVTGSCNSEKRRPEIRAPPGIDSCAAGGCGRLQSPTNGKVFPAGNAQE